jgi:N-acetylmuramoyl-L-alanine amidase
MTKEPFLTKRGGVSMFPIEKRLLTPNQYSRPQRRISVKGIVIHWTANESRGADAEANRRFFENRKHGRTGYGSAHYFVDSTEIVQCIPDNEMAYHVGATSYKTSRFGSYPNNCLLGIEMCVNADGDFQVVYDQTVELTAKLVKKYGLDVNDIVRHFDVTGKNCPAMFTSNHWGKTNNDYAKKYGVGSNADAAWGVFKQAVKDAVSGKPKEYPYDTDKGIGTVKILVDSLNIRNGASFDDKVIGTVDKNEVYYVYQESNGLYKISNSGWVSAGSYYTQFTPHPKKSKKEEAIAMFKDIANHWAKGDIESLAKKGIAAGDSNGNFRPEDNATRAHVAVFINRALEYIEKNVK